MRDRHDRGRLALERLAASAWPAIEQVDDDGWLLRAALTTDASSGLTRSHGYRYRSAP